jgi:hypothetical protein
MHELLDRRTFLRRTSVAAAALAITSEPAVPAATPSGAPARRPWREGLVAFRISSEQWLTEARFEAMLAFFRKEPGTADEWLSSQQYASAAPLAEEHRAERLANLMPRAGGGMGAGSTPGDDGATRSTRGFAERTRQRVAPQGRESLGVTARRAGVPCLLQKCIRQAQAGPDFVD